MRNLVDNALRYAGEGARIEVRLARTLSGCVLGLSIVARIAALSHAQLELGDGLPRGGRCPNLSLPDPPFSG